MKKTLLLFVSLLMTMGMFAQSKTATFDFTGESAYGMTLLSGSTKDYNADPTVCIEGDVTLTLNGQTRWWKATNGNELRFYKGADMTFKVPEGNVITKVELTAKVPAKFESAVGTYANGTWTGSANSVVISTNITEKNTPISSAVVTYQSSSAPMKKDPALSFSETTASGVVGEAFVAPTLTKATTAAVVYTSSDEAVATVNAETGEVTLLAAGETKITATAAENDEYNGGSASYTLTVTTPALDVVKEPYSESFETEFGSFVLDNVNLSEGLSYVWSIDKKYKCAKASAYVNKKNLPSESWLVSPWIELLQQKSYVACILTMPYLNISAMFQRRLHCGSRPRVVTGLSILLSHIQRFHRTRASLLLRHRQSALTAMRARRSRLASSMSAPIKLPVHGKSETSRFAAAILQASTKSMPTSST